MNTTIASHALQGQGFQYQYWAWGNNRFNTDATSADSLSMDAATG